MSTRSRIAVELNDGTVKSVYCHWDGYPAGVGNDLLNRDFRSAGEVEDFLNEGSRSTVDEAYYDRYGESRGEKRETPTVHKDADTYLDEAFDWEEYAYLYNKDGEWTVTHYSGRIKNEKVIDILEEVDS
jgi:hypothetical protein